MMKTTNEPPLTPADLQARNAGRSDENCSLALSSLMDGEAGATEVQQACAAWRDATEARATWHAYHLIGDVLRSDELAQGARHDAAFLTSLRERLANEPVPLAPQPAEAGASVRPQQSRWRWAPPMAVAAGFMVVAGALVVLRMTAGQAIDQQSALAPAGVTAPARQELANALVEPASPLPGDKLLRDARLNDYLVAHKQFGGSTALGIPSGFLRNATYEVPLR